MYKYKNGDNALIKYHNKEYKVIIVAALISNERNIPSYMIQSFDMKDDYNLKYSKGINDMFTDKKFYIVNQSSLYKEEPNDKNNNKDVYEATIYTLKNNIEFLNTTINNLNEEINSIKNNKDKR